MRTDNSGEHLMMHFCLCLFAVGIMAFFAGRHSAQIHDTAAILKTVRNAIALEVPTRLPLPASPLGGAIALAPTHDGTGATATVKIPDWACDRLIIAAVGADLVKIGPSLFASPPSADDAERACYEAMTATDSVAVTWTFRWAP